MSIEELMNLPDKEMFALSDLVRIGLTKKAAYRNIAEGRLIGIKVGKRWYIPRKALIAFLQQALEEGVKATTEIKWLDNEKKRYEAKA